jgi:ELWxxDGT repeat protein
MKWDEMEGLFPAIQLLDRIKVYHPQSIVIIEYERKGSWMRNFLRFAPLACLLLLGRALAVEAQSAVLLRDISQNASPFGDSSGPRQLTVLDGKVVFSAVGDGTGQETWVSDGTTLGTQMLADACPGICDSSPLLLGTAGHTVLWLAVEEPYDRTHLWRSDGKRSGTYRLGDEVEAGQGNVKNRSAATGGGVVYFVGCTDAQGCEPWRSDGTREGTRMIKDLSPGAGSSSTAEMTYAGGRVFFSASPDLGAGPSLWVSDGTAAHTVSLGRFRTIHDLTAAAGRLFFFGGTGDDEELWTSDGTAAGTRQVSQFHAARPFAESSYFPAPLVVGDHIYFEALEDGQGIEIWRGDASGVQRLSDLASTSPFLTVEKVGSLLQETGAGRFAFLARKGSSDSSIYLFGGSGSSSIPLMTVCSEFCGLSTSDLGLAKAGSRAVFRAGEANQSSLWSTDGTSAGTVRLTPPSLRVATPPVSGGGPLAYFWAYSGGSGLGLWSTDGTTAGTKQIAWSVGGLPYYGLPDLAVVGSRVFFSAETNETGDEIWVTDGTREGSHLVLDLQRNEADSNPQELVPLGDQMFFSDCGVWRSAGTPETTQPMVADDFCLPSGTVGYDTALTPAGNLLFFLRGYPQQGLWRTDGTAAGTFQLTSGDVAASGPVAFKGKLYFLVNRQNARPEIWSSDGTVAGTAKAFDPPQPLDIRGPLYAYGSSLYFNAGQGTVGPIYWISDGTTAGTRQLFQAYIYQGLERFVSLGGITYIQGDGLLVRSDGTADGTAVLQLSPDNSIFNVQDLTVYHGALYFTAGIPSFKRALFRSDGTPGGTVQIRSFEDPQHAQPNHLTVFQDQLFFAADDGEHGFEIWKSDGTPEGTVLLKDVAPGPAASHPEGFAVGGDRLYFVAGESVHGRELWKTDGTTTGTELAQDLLPLSESSNPGQPVAAGGHLFFSADDGLRGRELWALPLGAAATACQPSDTSLCLNGQRFRVEARWQDFEGHSGDGHAVALTPDTGYFWFFDPKNVETILKVLDGQGVNGHFWVFYGGLSNLDYELTVTDTRTGLERRYFNLPGRFSSVGDIQGFGPLGAYKSRTVAAPSPPPVVAERFDAAAATGTCVPGPDRLCLNDGRFSVQATWKDLSGHSGAGTAVGLTGDTGYFWFFDAANVEVVLKVLDGRPVNGKFWVYYGALSNLEYTLTVTDTVTGKVKTYKNPPGRYASAGDSSAF